ncbi:permease-like cell division protein FtsX [Microbispora sp. H10836]|uniref:permease-like cell division protein FtsX n=1 Tax=Microbispora sp. H10836 TaxID=2729106 RepID=UPI001474EA8B|nr:permease-like cell division protein FtsX [Microbispora sp. H10836]
MTLPGAAQAEEITIGESRGPRRGPLLVAAAAVLVVALAAGGVFAYRASREPSLPPDGPWPRTGTFLVHLCGPPSPYDGRLSDESPTMDDYCPSGAATAAQRREIERVLTSHAETRGYRRLSPAQALAIARQDRRVGDMLDEYLVRRAVYGGVLAPGDWRRVLGEVQRLPGVFHVESYRDDFWWGKADAAVRLCRQDCEGGVADRRAVFDRIRGLPGVAEIYFEDAEHAAAVMRHRQWWERPDMFQADRMPEAFHIRFAGSWDLAQVQRALTGMPGVVKVVRQVRPL